MPVAVTLPVDCDRHVDFRPLRPTDASAVAELIARCEVRELGEALIGLADIEADWQRPGFSLTEQTVGLFDHDVPLAFAEVHGDRAEVFVDPSARGRGLGTALMSWTWTVAATSGQAKVGQSVPASDLDAIAMFRRRGYSWVFTSWVLELDAGHDVPVTGLPEGLAIRPFRSGVEDRVVHRVIEDAFNWPDRTLRSYDDWRATVVHRSDFDPETLLVLVDGASGAGGAGGASGAGGAGGTGGGAAGGAEPSISRQLTGQVLGVCWWQPGDDEVWVNSVAVRADRRGQGLGRALLARAFADGRARGLGRARLSTDTRTGALGLYQHLGMSVRLRFEHWSRPVP